jgi:hypothetical protein
MMALDSCNIQSSPHSSTAFDSEPKSKVKKKTNGHAKLSGKAPSKNEKTPSNGSNGKATSNGVHVNGIHGNARPIAYVPVEPPPNSAAATRGFVSTRSGECTTCGRKNVFVSAPPMSRCTDHATCEETRKLMGLIRSGKPIPVTKQAIVCTKRHKVEYYLKVVYYKTRELQVGEIVNAPIANRIIEKTIGEALELVREKNEATKFAPDRANQLAAIWGAVAREV